MKPVLTSVTAQPTRAAIDAFDARVEACRRELDSLICGLMDRGHSGQVLLAALMREAIAGTLELRRKGHVDAAFVQLVVDRIVADTAKARTQAGGLTIAQ
jgi:hypothetical protein